MKTKLFFIPVYFILKSNVFAQSAQKEIVGSYQLTGVRELASGFELNADSSFQFYMGYGALDRSGTGVWYIKGDSVVFNGHRKEALDYQLVKSEYRKTEGIVIKITAPNTYLTQMVFAQINGGQLKKADNEGIIYFGKGFVGNINLIFQFCPEKSSKFEIKDKAHNYFEFSLLPSIFEIKFENLKLKIGENSLKGKLSVLDDKEYNFHKEN